MTMAIATDVTPLTRCLSAHPLFRCADDVVETCKRVSEVFRPHRLSVRGSHQRLNAQMDHVGIGRLSINRLRYETGIVVESEPMSSFLMLMMPLAGSAEIHYGQETVFSTPSAPAMVSATRPLAMRWSADCEQLILRIDRGALEQACSACLGHALHAPLEFSAEMKAQEENAAGWHSIMSFLASNEGFLRNALEYPLVAAQAEQLLLMALLHGHSHNYRDEMQRPTRAIAPSFVRRAEEFMRERADQPLTLQDVAAHAGVSVRSLHAGFQRYRNTSPMSFLRDLRLDRVHAELQAARESGAKTTVADIAMNWGFLHLGHFARAYAQKFGELPSQVLRS